MEEISEGSEAKLKTRSRVELEVENPFNSFILLLTRNKTLDIAFERATETQFL